VSVTSNTTTAPDGSQTGDTVTRTADVYADVRQTKAVTSGTSYTMSIFAKAETDNEIELDFSNSSMGTSANVTFNTRTGQKVSGSDNYTITEFANGWRRYSLTATCISSGNTGVIIRLLNDEPVQLWGFQTRAADDLVISGSDFTDFYNQSEGTFYVESQNKLPEIGGAVLMGQSSTRLFFYKSSPNRLSTYDGGSFTHHDGLVANQLFNAAVTFNTSNRSSSLDGSALDTDTINTQWAGADILKIGFGYSNNFTGHFRRILYWPYHSDSL
jgi:hypothetical protein